MSESLVRDQLREYRRTFVVTGLGSLTIAIGLAVVLAPQAPEGWLGWWLAAIVGTLAPGAALRPRRGIRDDESSARRRLVGHRAVLFLHGLAWAGMWPLMHVLPHGSTHDVIAFALVGLLTGAAITLSFELVACVLFLGAASLPLVAHFTPHTGQLGWFGPMALALFTLLLAVSTWRGWQGFLGSVQRARDARAVAEQSKLLDRLLTETRRSSAALQASQAELRAVLEAFPGYIAAIGNDGRYTYVNTAMAQLMGRAPQDIVGQTVEDIIPDRAAARRDEFKRLGEGGVLTDEMRIEPAGGGPTFYMQNTRVAGPPDEDGRFVCYAFGVDITALKEGEAWLREAKEEAERANQAKSQFLSQMSHELRTPLNAILGFGQLLASDQKAPLPPGQQLQVQEILAGAQHLLRLINGLLDIGRIEAGRFSVQREPVAVAQVLQDALRLLAPLASAHQVDLPSPSLFVSGPDTAHVWADRTRLVQVVLNLLGNAIKYNRAGGSVHIECTVDLPGKPPLPSPPEDGGLLGLPSVTIRVIDEGRGLTEDEQARLFEPFERLSAEASRIEGTGIGLALSRRLVQAMGGTIGVDSTPGVGSRFWVCLPQAPGVAAGASRPSLPGSTPGAIATRPEGEGVPAPAPGPDAAESGEPHRTTLLYIEDNPVNTLVMRAMIERMPGVQLVDCEDAETGLQLAAEHRPALILTDLQMPGMDGFELLERLRADPSLKATPVVAISADAMPQTRARGAQAGFDDFLTKPVEMGALQAVVARLLRR